MGSLHLSHSHYSSCWSWHQNTLTRNKSTSSMRENSPWTGCLDPYFGRWTGMVSLLRLWWLASVTFTCTKNTQDGLKLFTLQNCAQPTFVLCLPHFKTHPFSIYTNPFPANVLPVPFWTPLPSSSRLWCAPCDWSAGWSRWMFRGSNSPCCPWSSSPDDGDRILVLSWPWL